MPKCERKKENDEGKTQGRRSKIRTAAPEGVLCVIDILVIDMLVIDKLGATGRGGMSEISLGK